VCSEGVGKRGKSARILALRCRGEGHAEITVTPSHFDISFFSVRAYGMTVSETIHRFGVTGSVTRLPDHRGLC